MVIDTIYTPFIIYGNFHKVSVSTYIANTTKGVIFYTKAF